MDGIGISLQQNSYYYWSYIITSDNLTAKPAGPRKMTPPYLNEILRRLRKLKSFVRCNNQYKVIKMHRYLDS